MKVFDSKHIEKGWAAWWEHFKRAAGISVGFAVASIIVMVHAIVPFFLPEFASRYVERLYRELEIK